MAETRLTHVTMTNNDFPFHIFQLLNHRKSSIQNLILIISLKHFQNLFSAQIGVLFVCVFGLTVLSITIDYYHSEISLSLSLSVALYISPKAKRENAAMASVIGCMYLLWLESNSSLLTNQWRTCLCISRLIENEWVETTKYQIVSRITISATTGTGTKTGIPVPVSRNQI